MYIGSIIGNLISGIFGAGNALQGIVTNSNIWATLLFAVVLAPVVEELIFRKMIVSRLRKYGDRTAILVSSLLFALLHGNLSQLFYAFGLGCLLGYVYARTGKLRYSIGLHMTINFLGSFVGVLILPLKSGVQVIHSTPAD
jgi:membrane protease YdiL (CAAX protease family)